MPSRAKRLPQVLLASITIILSLLSLAPLAKPTAADLAGCPMFPPDNIWNARVDSLPVHVQSSDYITTIGRNIGLHPDFGANYWDGQPIGMFYTTVVGTQPLVPIQYTLYGDESDPGPFPIPPDALIEGGNWLTNTGDRHVMVVDTTSCTLYELYKSYKQPDHSWNAQSGAVFSLTVNGPLRPDSWTSADAAGLPILPGLARYDEAAAGAITHALRFTAACTAGYIWPGRHDATHGSCDNPPPLGLRVRLKSSYVIDPNWSPQTKAILVALKRYGLILADNGTSWYISGTHDSGWDDDSLVDELKMVKGSDFEAVDVSSLMLDYDSGQVRTVEFTNWQYLPLLMR